MTGAPAPGWYPDPLGRHEHRYWNGATWTEHVADRGGASTDPLAPAGAATPAQPWGPPPGPTAPPHPAGPPPGPAGAPPRPAGVPGGMPAAPPPAARGGPPMALLVGIVVAVVAVVGLVAFVLLRDGGGGTSGTGIFSGQVRAGAAPELRRVEVPDGGTLVATARPSEGLDAEVNLAVDEGLLRQYAEKLAEGIGITPDELIAEAEFDEDLGGYVLTTADEGFEGEPEVLDSTEAEVEGGLIAGTYVVSVTGYDDTEGTYELEIEVR